MQSLLYLSPSRRFSGSSFQRRARHTRRLQTLLRKLLGARVDRVFVSLRRQALLMTLVSSRQVRLLSALCLAGIRFVGL